MILVKTTPLRETWINLPTCSSNPPLLHSMPADLYPSRSPSINILNLFKKGHKNPNNKTSCPRKTRLSCLMQVFIRNQCSTGMFYSNNIHVVLPAWKSRGCNSWCSIRTWAMLGQPQVQRKKSTPGWVKKRCMHCQKIKNSRTDNKKGRRRKMGKKSDVAAARSLWQLPRRSK